VIGCQLINQVCMIQYLKKIKMKKISLMLLIVIFIIACNDKEQDKGLPMNNIGKSDLSKYKELALTKGDTNAYYQLQLDYMDSPYKGFLNIAMNMADKHGYHLAYYNVYECLTDESTDLNTLSEKNKDLALKYLIEGANKGNRNCMNILGNFYVEGKYLKKDIEKGKELIKKSNIE